MLLTALRVGNVRLCRDGSATALHAGKSRMAMQLVGSGKVLIVLGLALSDSAAVICVYFPLATQNKPLAANSRAFVG